jgi:cysteine desulfurase
VGKIPLDVAALGVDLLAISAHKMYGPKGVGALYVRRRPRVRLSPLFDGGGQERGLRAGTLNVPGIVGLGMACELARFELAAETQQLEALREVLRQRIAAALPGVELNGHPAHRLPGNLHLSFAGVDGTGVAAGVAGPGPFLWIGVHLGSAEPSRAQGHWPRGPASFLAWAASPPGKRSTSPRLGSWRW